jgi:predicted DNA-binding transcriptional regulator AlpA
MHPKQEDAPMNKYGSDREIGEMLAVSRATVRRWARTDPTFPKPVKFSEGCTRWRIADIEAWAATKREDA